jgi:mannose-6-phosphate isomerase-like protein (cupin superfamily)
MSTSSDRRWEQRRFLIEESATRNGGKRTTFVETMTPGTSVPPHYHNRFSETFDLLRGAVTVYTTDQPDMELLEKSASSLATGDPQTVEPGRYHRYTVGDEVATLRVTLTPGNLDFERLLKILGGLARDGDLETLSADLVMMAVVMDLADAHLIGPAREMLDGFYAMRGEEVLSRKEELLKRYDTDEALGRLMGDV